METADLKDFFIKNLNQFSENETLNDMYWREINWFYNHKNLHYHTLQHLSDMLIELLNVKIFIKDWNAVVFALFYHDCVYNTANFDNEEQSAKIAYQRLSEINVPQEILSKVNELILATKYHRKNQDQDINYFIDADLSILGQSTAKYSVYSKNIRKEYEQFPTEIYNHGRKNVLKKFITQDQIYKTDHFNYLYEQQARENLDFEINQL